MNYSTLPFWVNQERGWGIYNTLLGPCVSSCKSVSMIDPLVWAWKCMGWVRQLWITNLDWERSLFLRAVLLTNEHTCGWRRIENGPLLDLMKQVWTDLPPVFLVLVCSFKCQLISFKSGFKVVGILCGRAAVLIGRERKSLWRCFTTTSCYLATKAGFCEAICSFF